MIQKENLDIEIKKSLGLEEAAKEAVKKMGELADGKEIPSKDEESSKKENSK